jgi:DNA modification methylase/predicted  nucleic acid-binding Zn-ribbon protein
MPADVAHRCDRCGAFFAGARLRACGRCGGRIWREIPVMAPAELARIRAPYNPRKPMDDEMRAQLRASLLEPFGCIQDLVLNRRSPKFGWKKSDPRPVLVGGNQRALVGQEMGLAALPIVWVDVDRELELKLNLRLNAIGADFDPDGVKRVRDELESLGANVEEIGFTQAQLDAITAGLDADLERHKVRSRAATEDDREELPTDPVTQPGDVWECGLHRIVCANALEGDLVASVIPTNGADCVVTDPPYAIYGSASGLSSEITDDKIVRPFFRSALRAAERVTRLFGHIYIFCDWRSWPSWWEEAKGLHVEPKNLLVWDKGGAGLGSNYANTYELVGFFAHMPPTKAMAGQRKTGQRSVFKSNILRFDRVTGADRLHNAAKPVELLRELLDNSTEPGGTVVDLFLGSGSTLIAAEELGRRCLAADVDPKWCDVAVRRWERLTEKTAVRVVAEPLK